MAVASGAMAQTPTTNTGSEGYLSRSAVMFYDKNYTGTIDQARHAIELGSSDRNEDADYFIALSSYKRGSIRHQLERRMRGIMQVMDIFLLVSVKMHCWRMKKSTHLQCLPMIRKTIYTASHSAF